MLTMDDKLIILEAAKIIDRKEEDFACLALDELDLMRPNPHLAKSLLSTQFLDFLGKENNPKGGGVFGNHRKLENREARVMALLLFAEVG